MLKAEAGDTVWFHDFNGVRCGHVMDTVSRSTGGGKVACVRSQNEFKSVDVDSRRMWKTQQEAVLALAEKKQQEAARLLSEAADLFKRAGGMKDDAATESA